MFAFYDDCAFPAPRSTIIIAPATIIIMAGRELYGKERELCRFNASSPPPPPTLQREKGQKIDSSSFFPEY